MVIPQAGLRLMVSFRIPSLSPEAYEKAAPLLYICQGRFSGDRFIKPLDGEIVLLSETEIWTYRIPMTSPSWVTMHGKFNMHWTAWRLRYPDTVCVWHLHM